MFCLNENNIYHLYSQGTKLRNLFFQHYLNYDRAMPLDGLLPRRR